MSAAGGGNGVSENSFQDRQWEIGISDLKNPILKQAVREFGLEKPFVQREKMGIWSGKRTQREVETKILQNSVCSDLRLRRQIGLQMVPPDEGRCGPNLVNGEGVRVGEPLTDSQELGVESRFS